MALFNVLNTDFYLLGSKDKKRGGRNMVCVVSFILKAIESILSKT